MSELNDDFDMGAILQLFAAESEENLAAMEDALLALESRPGDAELLHTVFRVVHTLKGDASNLGLGAVAEFAHRLEDLLDRLRAGEQALTGATAGLLLESVDALRALVPAACAGETEMPARVRSLLGRVAAAAAEPAEPVAPGDDADDGDDADAAAEGDDEAPAPSVGDAGRAASRTLRVEVEKLDRTLDLVGEIAIARGRLTRLLEEGRPAAELLEAHREADRLHMELQEVVMRLRMVPLGPTFRPYLRTVRDVAFTVGKLATLELEGEEVEVDTRVAELLRDPLTHLVRNAIDHGVEAPAERVAAGKPAAGRIRLCASHEGGTITIRISDDGQGLSRERIVARARARGLIGESEELTEAQAWRLIFEPGFSTAPAVTELSGRGVGLDVVKRGVEALRGTIGVESRPGHGTTITLRLPLTLAVIDGFAVGVGDETYVMPLDVVVECLELPALRNDAGADGVLNLRGEVLPYLRLRDALGVPTAGWGRENVVVVRRDGQRVGLVVDHLHGEGQAVIKSLGPLFGSLRGVAGSTILGSGRVALILDVPAIVEMAMQRADAARAA